MALPLLGIPSLLYAIWSKIQVYILFALPWFTEKVFKILGLGVVTYYGYSAVLDEIEAFIFSNFDSLPADLLQILILARVDDVFAAYMAAFSILIGISVFQKWQVRKQNTLVA